MSHYLTMHADNPQPRLIKQAVDLLLTGKIIAYPTDSTYAIGCALTHPQAQQAIRRLRALDDKRPLTLLCNSISQASEYCMVDNAAFAILKKYTPGPYTFILPAHKTVPRSAQGTKRKVAGLRIPAHPIPLALVEALQTPLLSATLWLPNDESPISDPHEIIAKTKGVIDLILDGGEGGEQPTTVVDLTGNVPEVLREGVGNFNV